MANLNWPGLLKGPEALIAAAQDFTGVWVDLGTPQDVQGAQSMGLWLSLTRNGSTNMRVRVLALHTASGSEYTLPIKTVGASAVLVEPEYIEFNVDEDRLMVIGWDLDGVISQVQFQIQAGAVGAPAAQVSTAHLTTSGRA